jgi:hypothetical protein
MEDGLMVAVLGQSRLHDLSVECEGEVDDIVGASVRRGHGVCRQALCTEACIRDIIMSSRRLIDCRPNNTHMSTRVNLML